ncbi:TPA: relaxase/mobilization nuclease domain-containing protein [Pseudomonas aeruginosa]|uniref:relaxase/mobilization nuclease domain-containing protein n=1 Tax=Pseudomonas TaxID=286 RepID=UPI001379340D|nr:MULTISPECIES: relaxase/mobilization nuclease domain-containing protein [Pseudomonas]EKW6684638.1 relaxase/mobilization nuclease domain-containing protein [Pseudomonas aeruginosa]UWH22282.1 relaxase/mobilization nuclease domain-containing protein [Pseudomonas sp. HD6515]
MSTQKSRSGVYKASKYFHKDDGCVLFESNIYTPMNSSKRQIANAIATSIENDVAVRTKGRKQSVRSQHDMVSFHTNDNVTTEQAKQIVKELYEKTHNLSNRKYALGVHVDTDEVHVHIVWSLKDFNGKCYNVSNDYRVIERECEKLEQKYNLIVPENRISRDMDELDKIKDLTLEEKKNIISKKYKDKHPPSNERMLEVRGIISNKQQMKDALNVYINSSSSPSDFISRITENGFNIIHNGKSSFSIQYEDQIFKASELSLSYKTLKVKLGDDTGFEQTLKNKHNIKKYEDCSIASNEATPDYMKKINPKSVLATKFKFIQHSDKVEYFYNSASSKKSFEYYKDPSKVSFHDLSRQSAKAGIQRLVADAKPPQSFTVNGPDFFKKNIWLEFQLMGLEAKGFKLEGYKPTPADLEELKKIQEQYASMNKKPDPKPKAPTVAVEPPKPVEPVVPTPVENAPEKATEPTSQVDQHKVAASNDDLIDDLMKEFEPATPTPVAQAHKEAIEPSKSTEPVVDDLYTPMAPEPLAEPENHKVDGDYSTYSNDEIVEEFEWLQSRLTKSLFPGSSTRDIAGHREMDNIPDNRNGIKTGEVKRQYEFRQKLYNLFDEIKERDPSAAKQLEQAFKAQMANKRVVTFDLKPQLNK